MSVVVSVEMVRGSVRLVHMSVAVSVEKVRGSVRLVHMSVVVSVEMVRGSEDTREVTARRVGEVFSSTMGSVASVVSYPIGKTVLLPSLQSNLTVNVRFCDHPSFKYRLPHKSTFPLLCISHSSTLCEPCHLLIESGRVCNVNCVVKCVMCIVLQVMYCVVKCCAHHTCLTLYLFPYIFHTC